jgi:hypothetical protein
MTMPANTDHQKRHLFEKIQIQVLTVLLGLVVFFGLWPLVAPDDAFAPLTFLAQGQVVSSVVLLLVAAILAFVAGAITVHQRPVGGLMVATLILMALSFRSNKINVLLWGHDSAPAGAFPALLGELLIMLIVLVACILAAAAGRALVGRVRPTWQWRTPEMSPRANHVMHLGGKNVWLGVLGPLWAAILALRGGEQSGDKVDDAHNSRWLIEAGKCALATLLISQILLLLLCRSDQRGQLLFAVGGGFLLAVVLAGMLFPTRLVAVLIPLPLLVGAGYYIHAMVVTPSGLHAWSRVPLPARVLPIDWLSAGVGGVLLGFWISSRLRETKYFEAQQDLDAKAKA